LIIFTAEDLEWQSEYTFSSVPGKGYTVRIGLLMLL